MAPIRTKIKVCGLSNRETVEAALSAGVDYLGFVFYEPSPRNISCDQARDLNEAVAGRAKKIALTVDVDDQRLDEIIAALEPNFLQLHGDESRERVAAIKSRTGLPVIKAIKIRESADLELIDTYTDIADMLLFDAKMPDNVVGALPGGNGISFDWSLLGGSAKQSPFMLSGGLTTANVAGAISELLPAIVDVSSGVESEPGKKDEGKIHAFVDAVKRADKQDDAA